MSRKKPKPSCSFARRKFLIEGLETRCMLAGNVNVFVSGGNLIVQGDSDDNAVLIQQEGNGDYSVTGLDFANLDTNGADFNNGPTSINGDDSGDPVVFHGVTNDINVDLRGGNDGLGIGNNLEGLNSLAEECFGFGFIPPDGEPAISPQQVEGTLLVPRNLIVNLGDGNDFTAIDANVGTLNSNGTTKKGGVAVINAGSGNNGVAFGTEGGDFVADDLLISGGSGTDDVCVFGTGVRDFLSIVTGNGNNQEVRLGGVEAGHAQIITGNGSDDVSVSGLFLDRELVVVTGGGNDFVSMNELHAGDGEGPSGKANNAGIIAIVTGDGADGVEINGFNVDNMTIDTGSGDDGNGEREGGAFISNGNITHVLTVVTGSGNDRAQVNNVSAHDIVVDMGSGDDSLAVYNVVVAGNLTVVAGSGNDNVYLHSGDGGHSTINGSVIINTGEGDDDLEVVDQTIGKDLIVVLGNGANTAGIGGAVEDGQEGQAEGNLIVGRNLTLVGGANHDLIGLFNLSVHNDLFADLGAGNDELQSEDLTVGRNATLLLGSGDDHATINFANIAGNALIDAGSGNDTVTLDNESHIGKTATILMGAGDDTLNIFGGSTAKKLIARGGPGTDTFDNDLSIEHNGKTGNADVQEFENFIVD